MSLFSSLFRKKRVQEVVNASNPIELLPPELREEFKNSGIPMTDLETREDWILLLNCFFFGCARHDGRTLADLLQEYDEFQKQSSTNSQASVEYGSIEQPLVSPGIGRKRGDSRPRKMSASVERRGEQLEGIPESQLLDSPGTSASSVASPPTSVSRSPKPKRVRNSSSNASIDTAPSTHTAASNTPTSTPPRSPLLLPIDPCPQYSDECSSPSSAATSPKLIPITSDLRLPKMKRSKSQRLIDAKLSLHPGASSPPPSLPSPTNYKIDMGDTYSNTPKHAMASNTTPREGSNHAPRSNPQSRDHPLDLSLLGTSESSLYEYQNHLKASSNSTPFAIGRDEESSSPDTPPRRAGSLSAASFISLSQLSDRNEPLARSSSSTTTGSPQSARRARRPEGSSAPNAPEAGLQCHTDPVGRRASSTTSFGSNPSSPTVGRRRTPSTTSTPSPSTPRSSSPMSYMSEARLLQQTSSASQYPHLDQYFTMEDVSNTYRTLSKLGKGSYGNVYIAKKKKDKSPERFAVKKATIDTKRRAQAMCREIGNMRRLTHPNIVRFVGSYFHKETSWIVMEFCNAGTIRDLRCATALKESHMAYVMRELLVGLAYMHENGTMHRDIKGENVLLNTNGDVKIADLGLAVPAEEGQARIAGSKYWMAPEMILAAGYGPKADIYSLGCTLYELADGLPPYARMSSIRALFNAAKFGFPPVERPEAWSKDFHSFIEACTHPNPADRPTCNELLNHPFLSRACRRSDFSHVINKSFTVESVVTAFML